MKTAKILRRSILVALALVGTILIWRGLWEISELFFGPEISILLGVLILLTIGFAARKFLFRRIL